MKYRYWLTHVEGIGNAAIQKLLIAGKKARDIYYMEEKELAAVDGVRQADAHKLADSRKRWNLEEAYESFLETGIKMVTIEENSYPRRLRNLFCPPYAIFYKGQLPEEEKKAIAIVGARQCSEYGRYYAKRIAAFAAQAGMNVISGMALGIDGAAHLGAMEENGTTYAVLGCGVDCCYPKANRGMYEYMTEHGGVLSEYVPETSPLGRLFPQRNRIISGLSDVVVIIEAKERSGSLITADFALEQGKDIYVLPGRVCDALSSGCNRLIRQGAGIIVSVQEFFRDIAVQQDVCGSIGGFAKEVLEKDEGLVYSMLDLQPRNIEELLTKTGLDIDRMCDVLLRLENLGLTKELFKNSYIKIKETIP